MAAPHIKLFKTPISQYFYDVGKNEIIKIEEDTFRQLFEEMNREYKTFCAENDEINELRNNGYLSCKHPIICEHPYSRYLPLFLDRKLMKITLQVTQSCNFRCKYCIYSEDTNFKQRTHSSKRMSYETAKQAVDFLWEHSVDSPTVNIGFYGGEPLLEFKLIKEIIAYAEGRFAGKPITFNITTNGSLLSDEIIQYFIDHHVSMMISLDGPKEINDENRVFKNGSGTYDTVIHNIALMRQKYPDFAATVHINMVIDPSHDFDCYNEIMLESQDIDLLNLNASTVYNTDNEISYSLDYIEQSEYHLFLAYLGYFGVIPNEEVSPIARKRIDSIIGEYKRFLSTGSMSDYLAPSGPCVPGQLRLFVSADGDLYPCERVNESTVMKIGSLTDGFDIDNARRILNIGLLSPNRCSDCWAIRLCSLCAKTADDGKELTDEKKKSSCNESIARANTIIRSIIALKEIPAYYRDMLATKSQHNSDDHRPEKRKENISFFPICADTFPIIDQLARNNTVELTSLLTYPGSGLDGKSISRVNNRQNDSAIAMDVCNCFDELVDYGDALYVADYSNSLNKGEVHKVGIKVINKAIDQKKNVKCAMILSEDEIESISKHAKDKNVEFDYLLEKERVCIDNNHGKLYSSAVPVIFVGGIIEQADNLEVFLKVIEGLRTQGIKVKGLSPDTNCSLLGVETFSKIINEQSFQEQDRVYLFNNLIEQCNNEEHPDVIVVHLPEAMIEFSESCANGFGFLANLISKAIIPDFFICCLTYELADSRFVSMLSDGICQRYGFPIDCVHVSNTIVDGMAVFYDQIPTMTYTTNEEVEETLSIIASNESGKYYNAISKTGIERLVNYISSKFLLNT